MSFSIRKVDFKAVKMERLPARYKNREFAQKYRQVTVILGLNVSRRVGCTDTNGETYLMCRAGVTADVAHTRLCLCLCTLPSANLLRYRDRRHKCIEP